jgi:perosamine synthetase
MFKIPFCKTTLGEEEKKAVCDVIDSGWVVRGPKCAEFEKKFAEYVGAKEAVYVDSCTSAMFMTLLYLTQNKKQYFVVPSITFAATPEVVVNTGNIPVFEDISLDDFCLENVNEDCLPVHLTGNKAKPGARIYDSAHRIEKDDVKDSDAFWCYSFYATKNMTTIQGGAIATNDSEAAEWLRKMSDHGISCGTEERYLKNKVFYSVDRVGWREKSDDIHAAVGLEQLKKLPWMTEQRNRVVSAYNTHLQLDRKGNHVYPVMVDKREEFLAKLKEVGVQCSIHFLPLHKMPAYKKYADGVELPNTELVGNHLVSLPLYPTLTNDEIEFICDKIKQTNLLLPL